jgi:uncharacterized paraquat-inducible protein A
MLPNLLPSAPVRRNAATLARRAAGPGHLIGPLLVITLLLLPLGWWLPLIRTRLFFFDRGEISILSGVRILWNTDTVLCLLVVLFSMAAPVAKGLAALWLWYRVPIDRAGGWLVALSILSKASMAEAFLIAVIVVGFKGVGLGTITVASGFYLFAAIVTGSLALSVAADLSLRRAQMRA